MKKKRRKYVGTISTAYQIQSISPKRKGPETPYNKIPISHIVSKFGLIKEFINNFSSPNKYKQIKNAMILNIGNILRINFRKSNQTFVNFEVLLE